MLFFRSEPLYLFKLFKRKKNRADSLPKSMGDVMATSRCTHSLTLLSFYFHFRLNIKWLLPLHRHHAVLCAADGARCGRFCRSVKCLLAVAVLYIRFQYTIFAGVSSLQTKTDINSYTKTAHIEWRSIYFIYLSV